MRDWQIQVHQLKKGADQSVSRALREMINSLEQEHTLEASIAIGARLAAPAGLSVIEPGLNGVFIKPERDATSIR